MKMAASGLAHRAFTRHTSGKVRFDVRSVGAGVVSKKYGLTAPFSVCRIVFRSQFGSQGAAIFRCCLSCEMTCT